MMHLLKCNPKPKQRRRAATLAMVCFSAVVYLKCFLSAPLDNTAGNNIHTRRRHLLETIDESRLMDDFGSRIENNAVLSRIRPYTLEDAMAEAHPFKFTFAVLVFDPPNDTFVGYYPKQFEMREDFKKLALSMRHLTYMLRKVFPNRFTPTSDEFVVAFSSGDYAQLDINKLPYAGVAPVLHFGSVLRDDTLYPNMIAMPTPSMHLPCFSEWVDQETVCDGISASAKPWQNMMLGKKQKLEWGNLKPQVVWRGTNFDFYLSFLMKPTLRQPNFDSDAIKQQPTDQQGKKDAAIQILRQQYDELLPRWKGVVMTLEAELAAKEGELPWADIKFAPHAKYSKDADEYQKFTEIGVNPVGERLAAEDQAMYKYLIDIAGGGGTTWTGTHSKLGLPGLLFHHITPTKDYFHDHIKPYVHYVPVSPDLSDLKEKYEWAESNPGQARTIANQATNFARYLGSPEGFERLFQEDFVKPLQKVIDAYQPISTTHPGKSWMDILEPPGDIGMVRVIECKGVTYEAGNGCSWADIVKEWHDTGRYPEKDSGAESTA